MWRCLSRITNFTAKSKCDVYTCPGVTNPFSSQHLKSLVTAIMLPFGARPGNLRRSHGRPSANTNGTDSDGSDECIPDPEPEGFNPTLVDVLNVRHLLQWKLPRGLPEELIDMIVDAAEYWPSTEQKMQTQRTIQKDCDQVLLKTVPLCYDRNVYLSVPKLVDEPVLIIPFLLELGARTESYSLTPSRGTPLSQDSLQYLISRPRRRATPRQHV